MTDGIVSQEKSLLIHEWERCGFSHLFSMNWEKYFDTLYYENIYVIYIYIRNISKSMRTSFPYLAIVWVL